MSADGIGGPRVLLRRLREVLAGSSGPQILLDQVVGLIASNMVAEVCSIYLTREGQVLELFATEGLNRDAVHKTQLAFGEGLIGDIAAHAHPLNLRDAQAHPLFAYRPETGEESYHSLMGVPILRGGRVLGVVAVQNRIMREYTDEEIEALQTTAMVLAEMIASRQFKETVAAPSLPHRIEGRILAEGVAMGTAVLYEPRIEVIRPIAEDIEAEKRRMAAAIEDLQSSVDRMLSLPQLAPSGESRDVLEAYKIFAHDRGWRNQLEAAVASGLTAEAAVKRVHEETRARMHEITDPYLRERLADLDDLANRLYMHLTGKRRTGPEGLPQDAVIVARNMGPAELLDHDRDRLSAVLLEEGSVASHVAIVARALDIPVIGGCEDVTDLADPGDRIIVDGDHGQVFIRPREDVVRAFGQNLAARAERKAKYAATRDEPAVSKDGVAVSLNINAGLLVDLHHLEDTGADGIGLYRTELHFMVRASMPKVTEQTEYYRRVLDHAGDRRVVFRTLDIGGDKILPYQPTDGDGENPAMGWRAIRIALDRPALLKAQLRALLRAAGGRRLDVMFPMVAEVAEFEAARKILDEEVGRSARLGYEMPHAIKVGTMLEVPAMVWQLPALLPKVDFLSVGSNDLIQFFFAVDRSSPRVADRYDRLSPAALSILRSIVLHSDAAGVPVSLCGEMAGSPLEAMALIGIGFRTISMRPASIGPVKEMVCSLDVAALSAYMKSLYELPDHSLRERLNRFAQDHQIAI